MKYLTRQEQTVLFALVALVLLGLAVKTYLTATVPIPAHLPAAAR